MQEGNVCFTRGLYSTTRSEIWCIIGYEFRLTSESLVHALAESRAALARRQIEAAQGAVAAALGLDPQNEDALRLQGEVSQAARQQIAGLIGAGHA